MGTPNAVTVVVTTEYQLRRLIAAELDAALARILSQLPARPDTATPALWMSLNAARTLAGCSRARLAQAIASGALPALVDPTATGRRAKTRVLRDDLIVWVAAGQPTTAPT